MERIWKRLSRFNGFYEVSNDGFVKRLGGTPCCHKDRLLKFRLDSYGYRKVKLSINHKEKVEFVHKLVAEVFIGNRPSGMVINHMDGNHLNNNFINLEYVTQKENVHHARARGRCHQNFILDEEKVRNIKDLMANGMREIEVVRLLGIKRHLVNGIRMRRCWAHVLPTTTRID